jgi:Holliday junction resolvase
MGTTSQRKGGRVEREIVALHKEMGVYAERLPLSGASRYRGNGADVDVYARGKEAAPFVCEVKARKNLGGFVQLETWLADFDCLFLKRNNATPLVVLPWRVWRSLLQRS